MPKIKTPQFTVYRHHNADVAVREYNKGQHRTHCLCYSCESFAPDDTGNSQCPIAKVIFANCVKFNVVSPVWECPEFVEL